MAQIRAIDSFEECVAKGFPVMETYPEQCRTSDGRTFVRTVATSTPAIPGGSSSNSYKDLIVVDSPASGETVSSPLVVTGKARGRWYFEASFPVRLLDANGTTIAQGVAQAEGDWMTTEFVPFAVTLAFDEPGTNVLEGTLVFEKDNPSGLPQNADEFRMPIRFARTTNAAAEPGVPVSGCRPTGCSGQICSDEDMVSTCEFRAEYACYKEPFAVCERQANGACGWTPNSHLTACLAHPPALE